MNPAIEEPWVPYPLRARRHRAADRESAGESLWTETLSLEARNRLAACVRDQLTGDAMDGDMSEFLYSIAQTVCDAAGATGLVEEFPEGTGILYDFEFVDHIRNPLTEQGVVFGLIEGLWRQHADWAGTGVQTDERACESLTAKITEILEDHRIGLVFVNGQFLPRSGSSLDAGLLVPALEFLTGDARFADADAMYNEALAAIRDRQPNEAITKACTALQSLLAAMGCGARTDKLSTQFAQAIDTGLLAKHDKPLQGWLMADRGNLGSAHPGETPANRDDAWLTVHVVGSIILRLSRGEGRGTRDENTN